MRERGISLNRAAGWAVLGIAVLVATGSGPIQASTQSEEPDAGHREFDFVIGRWNIEFRSYDPETGALTSVLDAVQEARYVNGGTLIVDEWTGYSRETGEQVTHGVTLRSYSPMAGRWEHTFLRSNQEEHASVFSGEWRDDAMHAAGSAELDDGRTLLYRLRFYDIEDDSFNWMEEWSIDGGANWRLVKTQVATRNDG
ncbi:MAG: hypothetical protein GKS06_20110 [Acidobacteria bacterium]|nr:hypothetical protein [Acidobacteriota bacterium]